MCLAIYKPKNKSVPLEYLKHAKTVNPDGIGIAYSDRQGLHVYKTLDKIDTMIDIIDKNLKNFDLLIHFRYATKGHIEKDNCHPFLSDKKNLALIHNGTFYEFGSPEKSDTKEFCEKLVFPIFAKTGYSKGFLNLMEHFAQDQRLATIDHNGKVMVYCPKNWIVREGVYYSNSYSLPFGESKKRKNKDPFYFSDNDFYKDWEEEYFLSKNK